MSFYEVISIVSLCLSLFVAVSCFIVPIIINANNKRSEQKQKLYNFIFEEQFAIINNFANAYANWKSDSSYKQNLISNIYWTATMVDKDTALILTELSDAITKQLDNTDETYFKCKTALLNFFGLDTSRYRQPKELISIRLRNKINKKY